jgi:hypothetical protein
MESAAGESAITSESASAVKAPAAVETAATIEPTTVEAATVEATPTEPGAGANEDPADEPVRAVVSVRRTGIGGIAVIAIRASRSPVAVSVPGVSRSTKANAKRHSLRVRISCTKQANRNQQTSNTNNPEVSHLRTPFRVRNFLIPNNSAGWNRNFNSPALLS